MEAMLVPRFGPPDVFELVELADPVPEAGQVVVDVTFAGVNFTDVRNRRGDGLGVPPFVPGVEVGGRISAIGAGVAGLEVGMPVAASPGGRGYAAKVAVDAHRVYPLPQELDGRPESGAVTGSLPAAIRILRRGGRVRPGESVLVHGASGGVAVALAQVAALDGLGPVYGTAGTEAKRAFAARFPFAAVFPTDDFVDGVRAATGGAGVDVVFDPIGGRVRADSFEALARFGRLVHIGNASLEPETVPEATWLRAKEVAYVGYSSAQDHLHEPEPNDAIAREGLDLAGSGQVDPAVTEVHPLRDAALVHTAIEERRVLGKVVLAVGG